MQKDIHHKTTHVVLEATGEQYSIDRYFMLTRPRKRYGLNRNIFDEDLNRERPQWIMSAYGPGLGAPIQLFGGFPLEQSMEEIRVQHYLALAAGNQQQSVGLWAVK